MAAPEAVPMRWAFLTLVILGPIALAPAGAQQNFPCDFMGGPSYASVTTPGPYAALPQEIHSLVSDLDGATIQIGLVRPDVPAGTKVPVIVEASPYYDTLQTLDFATCRPFLVRNFVPWGFAVALLPVRGTADSGGCMDLMGPKEQADLDQAISWLGTRGWSSGSVAMYGKSYNGATPWEVASWGNPHLKTIVPSSGVNDLYDLMFRQGNVEWRGPVILNAIYYLQSILFYAEGRSVQHTVEVTACPEYADSLAASLDSSVTGERDAGGFWAARNLRPGVEANYDGSIYLVQGLRDWNVDPGHQYPWFRTLEDKGLETRVMLGQWGHSTPDGARPDWADMMLAWFDAELREGPTVTGPRVQVQDSARVWRTETSWPPADAVAQSWDLRADGGLSVGDEGPPGERVVTAHPAQLQTGPQTYSDTYDEELWPLCQATCAAFVSAPLLSEYRFAGQPRLDVTVVPAGPGGHLTAYVYALNAGAAQRLGWGQLDLRFPQGGYEGSAVTPGEPLDVRIDLEPLDAVAPAGSQLALVVSQGSTTERFPSAPTYPVVLQVGGGDATLTFNAFER